MKAWAQCWQGQNEGKAGKHCMYQVIEADLKQIVDGNHKGVTGTRTSVLCNI